MKVKLLEIHLNDAWYRDRHWLIGETLEIIPDTTYTWLDGWSGGTFKLVSIDKKIGFLAIKYEEIKEDNVKIFEDETLKLTEEEWQELLTRIDNEDFTKEIYNGIQE